MATISTNNALYLYKLLKQELGCNRQTPLSDVEATLLADGIVPADLDCADINTLMEALPEFIKLTVFKKGRVFVTIMPHEDFDAVLDKIDEPSAADKAAAKGKPWKRKRGTKALRPQKPYHKEMPVPEAEAVSESAPESVSEAEPTPVPEPALELEPASEVTPEPEAKVGLISEPETKTEVEPELAPESDIAPEPNPAPELNLVAQEPLFTPLPQISLNITHTPQQYTDEPAIPAQTFAAPSQVEAYIPVILQSTLPQQFTTDVACPNDMLQKIYELAPANTDALELLQSSWNYARSTGALTGTRSSVSFALMASGNPTVTIQKSKTFAPGKSWKVVSITHSNKPTTNTTPAPYCASDELCAAQISAQPQASALDELARFALMGSWENVTAALKDFAPTTSFFSAELCSYLSAVFYRAQQDNALVQSLTNDFAAYNTGLLTPYNEDIYLCFTPSTQTTPWQFAGFSTTQTPGLGEKLSTLPQLPKAPNFDLRAQVLCIAQDASLTIPAKQLANILPGTVVNTLSKQDFLDACAATFMRAKRNYRLIAPVYSTKLNQVLLALPVHAAGLEGHALILKPVEKTYELINVVSYRIARGAAQTISLELPNWLV